MGFESMGLDAFVNLGGQYAQNQFMEENRNQQQEFNDSQANKNRAWQEHMSNTSYQRATADMSAAGLNPMLAYSQGGASTPPGGQAGGASAGYPDNAGKNMFGGTAAAQNMIAQTEKTQADTEKTRAETTEITARTGTHAVSQDQMRQQIAESIEKVKLIQQETNTSGYSAANLYQQTQNLIANLPQIAATINNLKAMTTATMVTTGKTQSETDHIRQIIAQNLPELQANLAKLEAYAKTLQQPGQRNESAIQDSFLGPLSHIMKALNPLSGIFSIAK